MGKRFEMEKIVEKHYQKALPYAYEGPAPLGYFVDMVKEHVKSFHILTRDDYQEDLELGYEGYTREDEIGKWVWDEGECWAGEAITSLWVDSNWSELKEGYDRLEDYIVTASVLDIMREKNADSI